MSPSVPTWRCQHEGAQQDGWLAWLHHAKASPAPPKVGKWDPLLAGFSSIVYHQEFSPGSDSPCQSALKFITTAPYWPSSQQLEGQGAWLGENQHLPHPPNDNVASNLSSREPDGHSNRARRGRDKGMLPSSAGSKGLCQEGIRQGTSVSIC